MRSLAFFETGNGWLESEIEGDHSQKCSCLYLNKFTPLLSLMLIIIQAYYASNPY